MSTAPAYPARILVVGNGARENALANALLQSRRVERLWITPANWGVLDPAQQARVRALNLDALDLAGIREAALELGIQLCVVGPEAPLCAGLADLLRATGIPCLGPGASAARLEGSKSFAKDFMARHSVPTARYLRFEDVYADPAPLLQALEQWPSYDEGTGSGGGVVLKADGLAAGKGVIVCSTREEALAAYERIGMQQEFGYSGNVVVLEERLRGPEISFMCLVAGGRAEVLPPSSDYKRLVDGDAGPNTGGMGNICPTPWATDEVLHDFAVNILAPTMRGLREDGLDYRGFLFVGTMLTPRGLRVIEYNVRFGDPEASVILPLCEADWPALFASMAANELPQGFDGQHSAISVRDGACVAVVIASQGYPVSKGAPQPIEGLDRVSARGLLWSAADAQGWHAPGPVALHFAGVGGQPSHGRGGAVSPPASRQPSAVSGQEEATSDQRPATSQEPAGKGGRHESSALYQNYPQALSDWTFMASGGRVLTISARGKDLSEARRLAYEVVGNLHFEGMQFRGDIGKLP